MNILHTITGYMSVNTYYLINTDTKEAIVIDGGESAESVLSTAKQNGFAVKYMLLTHAHFDHASCAKKLQDSGVKIVVSDLEKAALSDSRLNLSNLFGVNFDPVTPDLTFFDGQELNLCDLKIKAILTPGHSVGAACFIVDDKIFSGDTLFYESVGRIDFYGGNGKDLQNSLKKLLSIDGDFIVYPGHGESTTLAHERIYNPFI